MTPEELEDFCCDIRESMYSDDRQTRTTLDDGLAALKALQAEIERLHKVCRGPEKHLQQEKYMTEQLAGESARNAGQVIEQDKRIAELEAKLDKRGKALMGLQFFTSMQEKDAEIARLRELCSEIHSRLIAGEIWHAKMLADAALNPPKEKP